MLLCCCKGKTLQVLVKDALVSDNWGTDYCPSAYSTGGLANKQLTILTQNTSGWESSQLSYEFMNFFKKNISLPHSSGVLHSVLSSGYYLCGVSHAFPVFTRVFSRYSRFPPSVQRYAGRQIG